MLKWLFFALSFFLAKSNILSSLSKASGSTINIADQIAYWSRKATFMFVGYIMSAGLIGAGLIIIAINIASNYELTGSFVFTPTIISGLVLVLIGAVVFTFAYNVTPLPPKKRTVSLENTLSLLVTEFLQDRAHRRQMDQARVNQLPDPFVGATPNDYNLNSQQPHYRPRPTAV